MDGIKKRQWGTTPPVSEGLPTQIELGLTDALVSELKSQNNFEAPEETEKRTVVLKSIQRITFEFVKLVGRKKGMPQVIVMDSGGKIFTFGSYRLGVFGPGSDIDTLVVVPKHVTREDFFEHFPALLVQMSPPGAIEELKPVTDAFVPIIKLEYSGISIDLIFARLMVTSVPLTLDLKDTTLLRGLDETDLRCVNGTRVTDEILTLVPQVKTFRQALRAIKLWAQRRAIYANVMGFPGGVAWAMMVARICQLYPHATGSVVVNRFFHLLSTWPWPRPILLKNMEDGPLQVRIWNPQIYPADKRHLMPIITPAYPSMCATHNITPSTKKIIVRELVRASVITNQIFDNKSQWSDLFQRHTFFSQGYKYYLSIVAASKTREAQLIWSGLVESKVRRLVNGIESAQAGVELAHPFNKGFERVHRCKNEEEIGMVLKGELQFQATDIKTETTDVTNDVTHVAAAEGNADGMKIPKAETETLSNGKSEEDSKTSSDAAMKDGSGSGISTIYTTTYYVGIELAKDSKTLDISFPVGDFKRQCVEWAQYNPDLNSLQIVHTRNYDLPADVFEPGDVRPVRTRKVKTVKPAANPISKKRSFSETHLDDGSETNSVKRRQPSGFSVATSGS